MKLAKIAVAGQSRVGKVVVDAIIDFSGTTRCCSGSTHALRPIGTADDTTIGLSCSRLPFATRRMLLAPQGGFRSLAQVIDGRAIARELDEETEAEVDLWVAAGKRRPGLAVVLVGNDPATEAYVQRTIGACEKVGVCSFVFRLPAETTEQVTLALIAKLNADRVVHGILCQVPLPPHIDTGTVLRAIAPEKDVDGFHPVNVGPLSTGTGGIVPCTPLGVMLLLETVIDDFVGKDAVVIGKSNIVGKQIAMLLLERECTVTVTHIHTENLPQITRKAEIVVAAAGAPRLVRGDWIKPGAVVIDVGITSVIGDDDNEKLVGDVRFDEAQHAMAITPVPGGVGPMAIACLLHNIVRAARIFTRSTGRSSRDPCYDAPDRLEPWRIPVWH